MPLKVENPAAITGLEGILNGIAAVHGEEFRRCEGASNAWYLTVGGERGARITVAVIGKNGGSELLVTYALPQGLNSEEVRRLDEEVLPTKALYAVELAAHCGNGNGEQKTIVDFVHAVPVIYIATELFKGKADLRDVNMHESFAKAFGAFYLAMKLTFSGEQYRHKAAA